MSLNIKARILARKILLCYFFEQYVVSAVGQKQHLIEETEKITQQIDDDESIILLDEVCTPAYFADVDQEIAYIVQWFFSTHGSEKEDASGAKTPLETEPDYPYLTTLAPLFRTYEPIVRDLVNTHTVSFRFDEMDLLDRVIFILGYIEFQVLKTPKEVMINEMVELGKRYGDESASKLINGIAHKIFTLPDTNIPSPIDQ